ncbi:50S ribosomal protein L11 methyltransferase [Streptomyces sp. NPDC048441]|uniref:50S ribosomal protein L11 methyltransferase n=1 Tax=Streptomyces sp. NPDC048441 TaxID=3365552 RepID=UPI00371F30E3
MTGVKNLQNSLARSQEAQRRHNRPETFRLNGREWDLIPGVFSPVSSPTTRHSLQLLGILEPDVQPLFGSLLEVGCGSGVVAVSAALAGCSRVVASDINEAAVLNTEQNAVRHGVHDRLHALRSDVFDGIAENDRFDVVFWHSNYVLAPPNYQYRNMHERAYADPGYRTHRRFLEQAPGRLTAGGSAFLHFSTRGDLSRLLREAADCRRSLSLVASATGLEGGQEIEHLLLEISVAPDRARCTL